MAYIGRNRTVLLLAAITAVKLILAARWGWTADIATNQWSAEAFLAGHDFLDPNYTRSLVHYPVGNYLIAAAALLLSRASGFSFAFLIKVPAILSDLLIALLLRSLKRGGDGLAYLYLLNPLTFLLAVYQGQLHTAAAAGAVLAFWLAERSAPASAGLALAFAASVRQHFALLAVPILGTAENMRTRMRFAAALAAALFVVDIPILLLCARPLSVLTPPTTYGTWGYAMILLQGPRLAALAGAHGLAAAVTAVNQAIAPWTALLAQVWALAFAVWSCTRTRPELDLWRAALLYMLGIYTVTQGLGVQWLVWAVPLWLVVDRQAAVIYSWLAGAFTAASYWQWTLNLPYGGISLTAHLDLLSRKHLAILVLAGLLAQSTWIYCARAAWRLGWSDQERGGGRRS